MKKIHAFSILFFLAFAVNAGSGACKSPPPDIRPPAVAGSFYPSDPGQLKLAIQKFLEDSPELDVEDPVAILVPHAGYIYAGQIYADAYRQIEGRQFDVVVILGVNHTTSGFAGVSLADYSAFHTPLGDAAVDQEIVSALLAESNDCRRERQVQAREHSIEVQVPFIQTLFPRAGIVPVVIHPPDFDLCKRFGRALAGVLKNRRALIVISSDLSHYPAARDALKADRATLETVAGLDPMRISSLMRDLNLPKLETRACGEAAILAGLTAAKELGARSAVIAGYANSGDIALGDLSRVVGYGAVVVSRKTYAGKSTAFDRPAPPSTATPLLDSEKRALLAFARETIRRYLTTGTVPLARNFPARMSFRQGVFVTLKENGQLRGCIGHIPPDYELGKAVGAMALQAAFNDPRFRPLQLSELNKTELELSILTPMKSIKNPEEIVVGRDGVLLTKGSHSAVFLPQVATENNWGRDEMLDNLCQKGGMPKDCWKHDAKFQVFQAEVFSEDRKP